MPQENEINLLKERLDNHKAEMAAQREADGHDRRETRVVLSQLNENMIQLTSAVTEWKTRDVMFEQRLERAEDKVETLVETGHKVDLRLVQLESTTDRNSKANDAITAIWMKITTGLVTLAILGGLAYKMVGS